MVANRVGADIGVRSPSRKRIDATDNLFHSRRCGHQIRARSTGYLEVLHYFRSDLFLCLGTQSKPFGRELGRSGAKIGDHAKEECAHLLVLVFRAPGIVAGTRERQFVLDRRRIREAKPDLLGELWIQGV